jgi:hypothetical protein
MIPDTLLNRCIYALGLGTLCGWIFGFLILVKNAVIALTN